jgi:hypothetical protein
MLQGQPAARADTAVFVGFINFTLIADAQRLLLTRLGQTNVSRNQKQGDLRAP